MRTPDAEMRSLRAERDSLARELAELKARLTRNAGELQQSQRLLRYIAEYAPSVIYVKDLEGRFILSNRLHAEMLGRSQSEILGRCEQDFISAEEAAEIALASERVLASGETEAQEFRIHLPDGEHWFLEQIFPLIGDDGKAFALAGISTDVTRRRIAEDNAAVFRALVDHSPDGVLVAAFPIDWQHPLLHRNATSTALFPKENELITWLYGHVEENGADEFEATLKAGEVWHRELPHGQGDELRIFDTSAFVIESKTQGDSALAWIIRDVSESRRLSKERELLQAGIIAAQEEALDELSVPLMPLARGVLAVPLLGRYNHKRSQHLIEILTQSMVIYRARTVILDLTGVRDIEIENAALIDRIAQIVKLLGARLILTGIRAPVAMLLAEVDFDISTVTIKKNLGGGIALALQG